MKTLTIALCVLGVLAFSPAASAATTKTVLIKAGGFSPTTTNITVGDTVSWKNVDTADHQVVADGGSFASPILHRNQSYSFMFRAAGTYRYHDALRPKLTARIVVAGPPPAVTLAVSLPQIVFGQTITISGAVNNGLSGEQVSIYGQPFGQPSQVVLATVATGPGGAFSYVVKPTILTVYEAHWNSVTSQPVSTAVSPSISFGRAGVFVARVFAGRSFAGRHVQVQRLSSFGQWVTLKVVTLNASSSARFRVKLPVGVSRLRIALSVNQAGAGYLAGFSNPITFRRK